MSTLPAIKQSAGGRWANPRVAAGLITAMALLVYALGFRAASFSWFNAFGAASAHVIPGALVGIMAWNAQGWISGAALPQWFLHPLFACLSGTVWLVLMLAFTLSVRPDIIDFVIQAASLSTFVSGVVLYSAISMISAIATSRQRVAEIDLARARAELKAIRARIEPHFLFNALETISALTQQNPEAAATAIGRLGRLLRRVLSTPIEEHPDAPVPLLEELAFVRDYLAIEKLRFGDRLRVVERVDPSTLAAGLPPLTLQTLVENAVIHGLGPAPGPVTISVAAERQDEMLVIAVSDDGEGSPEESFFEGGLGLRLLRTRLDAHWSGKTAFDVASSPGHGTSVRIAVPFVTVE